MNVRKVAISALISSSTAAVYGTRNKEWPSWGSTNKATLSTHPKLTEVGKGLYACTRSGGVPVFTQKMDASGNTAKPMTMSSHMAFYADRVAKFGTYIEADTARTINTVEYSCGDGAALTGPNAANHLSYA